MKTPTTVLLVVIAALLAANLFVNLPPQEAKAQSHLGVAEVPHLVAVTASPNGHEVIVRIRSDGFADYKVTAADPDWEPQVWTPLPVNPDAPQSRPIAADGGARTLDIGASNVYRLWADGTVDHIRFSENAFIVTVASQGWITEPN